MCTPTARNTLTRASSPRLLAVAIAATVLVFGARQAVASQSPAGCMANNLSVLISKNHSNITNCTVVAYVVTVQNGNPGDTTTCDITLGSAGLVFICPDLTGQTNGPSTVLIPSGTTLQAGYGPVNFTNTCTVCVNPGVKSAQVAVAAPGALLHDNPLADDSA